MRFTPKLLAVAGGAVALAAGGTAIAAARSDDPEAESQAIVDDAARQLGIEPSRLSDALKKALENRVEAAVAAGRLTREEGDALKAWIESGRAPIFGGHLGHRRGHGPFGARLDAAASYLGLTRAELRSELAEGKTLASIARSRDKSVEGLVQALLAHARERLDAAVDAGRLTRAEAESMLEGLTTRIEALVNRTPGELFEGGPRFGAPPPFAGLGA